ncbi:MAG: DinB family protein [Flavobacteriaceae bacterium]|nr:DinB family protein [Flavobacteriaceae bacterium]
MKKSIYYLIFGFIAIGLFAFVDKKSNPEKTINQTFSEVLLHAKEYSIQVAEAMPAEDYAFKPSDSVRSFGEQMAHIGMSTSMILHTFIKGEEMKMDMAEMGKLEKSIGASKEKTIKLLNNAFDDAINSLKKMDQNELNKTFVFIFSPDKPEFTNEQGFLFLRDHGTHHRGQAIIYLRMKGIKAPGYRAF